MRGHILAIALVAALPGGLAAQELYGTLKKINDANAIVLGHREASVPFAYYDEQQNPVGYSIELCLRIVDAVKEELGKPDLQVRYVPVTPQTRIPLLANGTIDIECGSTTNNLTRSQQVDYLLTTFITGTKLAVRADSGIEDIAGLEGKRIAVAQGTTNERAVKAAIEEQGLDIDILNVKDLAEGMLALETDRVDAWASDHVLLHGNIAKARDPEQFAVVGEFLSFDPYALMVRRDDSAFRLVGNKVLAELFRSGEILELYAEWFEPLGIAMTDTLETAFQIQALPE